MLYMCAVWSGGGSREARGTAEGALGEWLTQARCNVSYCNEFALLGNSAMVARLTLDQVILVRIQVPQPEGKGRRAIRRPFFCFCAGRGGQ